MNPAELRGFVDLYDAEIRFTDEAVGALRARLEADGALDRTLIVLSADHGESLGENDYYFEHGDYGGESEIHIPLIVAARGELPEGARVPQTVRSIDIAPTVLDFLRIPNDSTMRGHSLLPLVEGRSTDDRSCFGETGKRFHDENVRREVEGVAGKWRWLRKGRFKLLHRPMADGTFERALYDLESAAGETADVAERWPDVVRSLGEEIDAFLAEDVDPVREYHITDEAREILRSLGYVD